VPDPRDPTPVRAVQRNGRWVVVDSEGRRLPGHEPTDDEGEARAEAHRVNQTWKTARRERKSKGLEEGVLGRVGRAVGGAAFDEVKHPRAPKGRRGGGKFARKPGLPPKPGHLDDKPLADMSDAELARHHQELLVRNASASSMETMEKTAKRLTPVTAELRKRGYKRSPGGSWTKLGESRLEAALDDLQEGLWNKLLHPRLPRLRRGGGQFTERPEVAAQQRELERDVQRGITDRERMANRVRWEAPPKVGRQTPPTDAGRYAAMSDHALLNAHSEAHLNSISARQMTRQVGGPPLSPEVERDAMVAELRRRGINPSLAVKRGGEWKHLSGGEWKVASKKPGAEGRAAPPTGGRRPRSIGSAGLPEGYLDRYQHPRVLGGEGHGAISRPLGPMRPEELRYSVNFALENVEYLEARAKTAEAEGRPGEAAEYRRFADRWRKRADELRGVEPIGSGEDPYGRPDPLTHPHYWTE
jgi:hypothetical protein